MKHNLVHLIFQTLLENTDIIAVITNLKKVLRIPSIPEVESSVYTT